MNSSATKVIALVKDSAERITLQAILGASVSFPQSVEECAEGLRNEPEVPFIVLDENSGDLRPLLEELLISRPLKRPLILVIVTERPPGDQAYFQESERVESYSNLGVELWLYRPFQSAELQNKIEMAMGWLESPPAWLQLLRVSRDLIRRREADRILVGLEKLHAAVPNDVHVATLLVRALHSCRPPRLQEALKILTEMQVRKPNAQPVLRLLFQTHMALRQTKSAFEVALALLLLDPSPALTAQVAQLYLGVSLQPEGQSLAFWKDQLHGLWGLPAEPTRELRVFVLRQCLQRCAAPEDADMLARQLSSTPELAIELKTDMIRLIQQLQHWENHGKFESGLIKVVMRKWLGLVLDCDPGHADSLEMYVDLQLEFGDPQAAAKPLRKMKQAGLTTFEYQVSMAKVWMAMGQQERARLYLDVAKTMANSDARRKRLQAIKERLKITS